MKTQKWLFSIFFFLFFFSSIPLLKATHILGADVSWKCNGDTSTSVTLRVYRDCNGIPVSASVISLVPMGCTGTTKTKTGGLSGGKDVTPICKNTCSRCTSSSCTFTYGIQEWDETVDFHFSSSDCCKWQVQWVECCVSGAMTTISSTDYSITSLLDRCLTPCDNSPEFEQPPLLIAYENKCTSYSYQATDPDGDSLVYKLVPALSSATSSVSYNSPYSYLEPLEYDSSFGHRNSKWEPTHSLCYGFHLDSFTGELDFKAIKQDVSLISMKVEEWRKNKTGTPVEIGEVERDAVIFILTSTNNPPEITSTYNTTADTKVDTITMLENNLSSFKVYGYDPDKADTVRLYMVTSVPGATFTFIKGGQHGYGIFSWKPDSAICSEYSYCPVTFVATDSACPLPGIATKVFVIKFIKNVTAAFSMNDTIQCVNKPFVFTYQLPVSMPVLWNFGDGDTSSLANPSHLYKNPGKYNVTLYCYINGKIADSITHTITAEVSVNAGFTASDTIICLGSSVSFSNTSTDTLSTQKYVWAFGDGDTSYSENPSHVYASVGKYIASQILLNPDGCIDVATKTLVVYSKSGANTIFGEDTATLKDTLIYTTNILPGIPLKWSVSGGIILGDSTADTIMILWKKTGKEFITLNYGIGKCAGSVIDTVMVYVIRNVIPAFSINDTNQCVNKVFVFTNTTHHTISFEWEFGDGSSKINFNTISHTYKRPGVYIAALYILQNGLKVDSVKHLVIADSVPIASFTASEISVCLGSAISFTNTSTDTLHSQKYNWIFGDGVNSSSENPVHIYSSAGYYTVKDILLSPFGCNDTASKALTIKPKPTAKISGSDTATVGDTLIYTSNVLYDIPVSWSVSGGTLINTSSKDTVKIIWDTIGKETVSLKVGSGSCSDSVIDTVIVSKAILTGITFLNNNFKNLKISPNPNNGSFRVSFEGNSPGNISISITDLTGQKILVENVEIQDKHFNKSYSLPVSRGIYFLTIKGQDGNASAKIVVY